MTPVGSIDKGVEVQERKGDHWHPSEAAGEAFLEHMLALGFEL